MPSSGCSISTTISRARTSSESSASSRSRTGSMQQSCSSLKASHSSRVRERKTSATSRQASEPGASNCFSIRSGRPTPLQKRGPELRLQRPAADPAVGGLVGQVAEQAAGELLLAAARHLAVAEVAPGDHRQPGEGAVGHRDVDHLALAGAPALVQRGHHPEGRHQRAAAEVGDLAAGLDRRAVLGAGQAEQPDQAEVVHVVAGALGVGAVLAVAGDRAEDDRRVGLAHPLVADPEPVEHAGAEAVEDDVVGLDQAQQRLAARART